MQIRFGIRVKATERNAKFETNRRGKVCNEKDSRSGWIPCIPLAYGGIPQRGSGNQVNDCIPTTNCCSPEWIRPSKWSKTCDFIIKVIKSKNVCAFEGVKFTLSIFTFSEANREMLNLFSLICILTYRRII